MIFSTNMGDAELCRAVAKVWVDGGGDAEGIDFCINLIKKAIEEEIANERC